MANIDVSFLLTDPDFCDPMTVITRFSQVSSSGELKLSEKVCQVESVGSVQPLTGREIEKIPELLRVDNSFEFWFKGVVITTGAGKYSSIILYQGMRYQIRSVDEWSNFGEGFCSGLCVREIPA